MAFRSSFLKAALTSIALVSGSAGSLVVPASPALASPAATESAAHTPTHKVVMPTLDAARHRHVAKASARFAGAGSALSYHGGVNGIGVTTGPPRVYLVFWGSQWGTAGTDTNSRTTLTGDTAGMAPYLQAMISGLGTNAELWSGVVTQYCEGVAIGATSCASTNPHVGYPTGGALAGVWYDNATTAPTQATGNQLAQEAVTAAGHFGNTTAASNRSAQYVVVSPKGLHPDGFNTSSVGWCAWHDFNADASLSGGAAASTYGDIAFTNLPYLPDKGSNCGANYVNAGAAGSLDGVSIVEGHELSETVTDQNPSGGWWDPSTGYENADKCVWIGTGGTGGAQNVTFATGSFAMQGTWSNDSTSCRIAHPIVTNGGSVDAFSVAASPTAVTVNAGSSTSATIATTLTSGNLQTVALGVSGTPAGMTASLSPTSVTTGTSSKLSVATTSSTAAGTYVLTVSGTALSGTVTTQVSITVNAPVLNDYSITLTPTSAGVIPGRSVSTVIKTAVTAGASQSIRLSVSGTRSGLSASLSSSSVTAGGSSTLSIATNRSLAYATYTLTINASAPSGAKSATFSLRVSSTGLAVVNPPAGGKKHHHRH